MALSSLRRQHGEMKVKLKPQCVCGTYFYAAPTWPRTADHELHNYNTGCDGDRGQARGKIRFRTLLPGAVYKLPCFNLRVLLSRHGIFSSS